MTAPDPAHATSALMALFVSAETPAGTDGSGVGGGSAHLPHDACVKGVLGHGRRAGTGSGSRRGRTHLLSNPNPTGSLLAKPRLLPEVACSTRAWLVNYSPGRGAGPSVAFSSFRKGRREAAFGFRCFYLSNIQQGALCPPLSQTVKTFANMRNNVFLF